MSVLEEEVKATRQELMAIIEAEIKIRCLKVKVFKLENKNSM